VRGGEHLVMFKLPPLLPRFIHVAERRFVAIESLLLAQMERLLPALKARRAVLFRVIRNSELSIDRDEVEDLRDSVEAELRRSERKQVVCLEVDARADDELLNVLVESTRTRPEDVYRVAGFLKLTDFADLVDRIDDPKLRYEAFSPRLPQLLATSADIFSIIRERDVLLHRPYDSFTAVIELLHAAATDPDVVAIKQTLYQTDEQSPVVDKLVLAARNGKQVTAVIELQARFEEKRNIALAERLHDAGAQVVYGLVGIQAHAKVCVIVRREDDRLCHYVHLSTGNYNIDAARVYTDLDLLTANETFGQEASQLVNVLTGFSKASLSQVLERQGPRPQWKEFVVAPFDYHRVLIAKIEREAKQAKEKKPARIAAQLSALVDAAVIDALYRAAAAGVKIELIVRGICCLVPRENIRVVSIIDRFLEHSRMFVFRNGGETEVWAASDDWMPRNFFRRIEVAWPILAPALRDRIEHQILATCLADDAKAWRVQPDGTYKRRKAGPRPIRSQQRFIEIARAEAVRIVRYDEALKKPAAARRKARRKRV